MKIFSQLSCHQNGGSGFTLAEVLISLGIGSLLFGGALAGYIQSATRAEWTSYNLAGHSMAMQHAEMARAAKWDTQVQVDELVASNFPQTVEALDVPVWGTNTAYATNTTTISTISSSPPVKMIQVATVWAFRSRGLFTNLTITYRSPDQ